MCGALFTCVLVAPLAGATPSAASAQSSPPPLATGPVSAADSAITVYLVTMGQGEAVWEKFGHNALWVRDPARGIDLAYNWGVFDFDSPGFIPRFLKGHMRYTLAAYPAGPMIEAYARMNRSVWTQELALTPLERVQLRDFVEWNVRPENAEYTYNYFLDNCSTRVRDLLDRVLGGQLRARFDTVASGTTYRWHTRRLTQGELPIYTGMNLVLGEPGDQPISAWEEMFLPMKLRDRVRDLTVAGDDGVARPLVASERELFTAERTAEPSRPTDLTFGYLLLGLVVAVAIGVTAVGASRGSRAAATGFATAGTLWSVLAGLVGVIMVLTWTVTDHTFMYRNENLLQLSPLSLLLAAVLPTYVRRGRAGAIALATSAIIALLAVLGFALQLLPSFDQGNGEIIALVLPGQLVVAWGVWLLRGRVAR